ncbi:minor tail protein [Microbacterium phage DelaGarza]|nr:minor tail protein [Microbacterium phage DelaGarza]
MQINDLTLEVRDRNLKRVGQVTPAALDLKARTKWSAVGEWTLTLPGAHPMVPYLSAPGSGIILLGPDGTSKNVVLSGPTRTPARKRDRQNPDGTFTFSGVTDEIVLAGALAFPNPAIADPQASSQSRSNDTRTGATEDLLRQFVAYNVAYTHAPAGRIRGLRSRLMLSGGTANRGLTQQKSPRFQNLLELLQEIVAYDPSLGFRVVQVGDNLLFEVLDSRDRTKFVRFDVENGTITSEEVQASGPNVTDAIVAGQGEGTGRTIIRRQSLDSIAAEEEWGVPFESFIDQRDTDEVAELAQSGDEALQEGQGGTAVKMIPADDTTMQVGKDWRAGDLVTTVVNGQETAARVTEVAYSVNSAGVMAGAALGDVSGFTAKDAESTTVQSLDSRVSNLERAASGPDVLNPTGSMLEFAGATAPSGWLLCDGAVLDRSAYPTLFGVIGTAYNTGGETAAQFRLPDRRGRVGVGRDAGQTEFDVLGERGGAKTHTLSVNEMPKHRHGHGANSDGYVQHLTALDGTQDGDIVNRGSGTHVTRWQAMDEAGGGAAHNNLQPYLVLNYIIKT